MKKVTKILAVLALVFLVAGIALIPVNAYASDGSEGAEASYEVLENGDSNFHLSTTAMKGIAAAIAIAIPAALGALGMGIATAKSTEGISRQPEASGKIQGLWMLGMVFIETLVIYALVVTILIVFVL